MSAISATPWAFRRSQTARPRKLHKGMDALANKVIGSLRTRRHADIKALRLEAERVLEASKEFRGLKEEALRTRLAELHAKVRREGKSGTSDGLRRPALAALAEAAWRAVRLRAYPEQIMGVLALEKKSLVEMATGEGKTLTIGLGAALAAWRGAPVHVITANDYLVQRDAKWLAEFYARAGLAVGHVTGLMTSDARRAGYAADITYATSKEVVADFLRDRLQMGQITAPGRRLVRQVLQPGRDHDATLVMRGLHTAIVDEADHVLIDEAVTPLIISRESESGDLAAACLRAARIARTLEPGRDYVVDRLWKDVRLREPARRQLDELTRDFTGLWRNHARREELVTTALKAREFFKRGQQYVVGDQQNIVIVDESTGRMMPQRTWKQGLQQAIEANEGVPLTRPTETLARLSFQRYFRLYPHLCGLTGTAREAAGEFWQIYALPVTVIPTHKPCIRQRPKDLLFRTQEEKRQAIHEQVRHLHEAGVPVLLGARSVEASEHLAARLEQSGLSFALLNAVRHEQEASIVAEAGQAGRITIATNMAGRGTDIKLGPEAEKRGGLHVLVSEMHESGRVDRQLFGRSARQGEPGSAQMFVSLEDELVRRLLSKPLRALAGSMINIGLPSLSWMLVRAAQRRAQRLAYRQRCQVLTQDEWLEESLAFARAP